MQVGKPNWDASRNLLANPDACAFSLLVIALRTLAEADLEFIEIDPVALWALLEEQYNTHLAEETENKLNAWQMLFRGTRFFEDVEAFTAITLGLVDGDLGDLIDGGWEDLDFGEIIWALHQINLAIPEEHEFKYSREVWELIEAELREDLDSQELDYREYFSGMEEQLADELKVLGITASLPQMKTASAIAGDSALYTIDVQ